MKRMDEFGGNLGGSPGGSSGNDIWEDAGKIAGTVKDKVGYGRASNHGRNPENSRESIGYGRAERDRDRRNRKSRKLVYQLRLSEDESQLLDMISYATDDSRADVIRKALKMYASVNGNSY